MKARSEEDHTAPWRRLPRRPGRQWSGGRSSRAGRRRAPRARHMRPRPHRALAHVRRRWRCSSRAQSTTRSRQIRTSNRMRVTAQLATVVSPLPRCASCGSRRGCGAGGLGGLTAAAPASTRASGVRGASALGYAALSGRVRVRRRGRLSLEGVWDSVSTPSTARRTVSGSGGVGGWSRSRKARAALRTWLYRPWASTSSGRWSSSSRLRWRSQRTIARSLIPSLSRMSTITLRRSSSRSAVVRVGSVPSFQRRTVRGLVAVAMGDIDLGEPELAEQLGDQPRLERAPEIRGDHSSFCLRRNFAARCVHRVHILPGGTGSAGGNRAALLGGG